MPAWLTDTVISTIFTTIGVVIGYFISGRHEDKRLKEESEDNSRHLLLEAQKELKETILKLNQLWAWNRQLQDHIYKRRPPPPPLPPAGLFDD